VTPVTRINRTSSLWIAALAAFAVTTGCAHNVRLITVPEGAEVTINGKSMGKGPILLTERSGAPGRAYVLSAELAGYSKVTRRESVKICPTPANLILDSFAFGFLFGFCMRDEYVLDLTATNEAPKK